MIVGSPSTSPLSRLSTCSAPFARHRVFSLRTYIQPAACLQFRWRRFHGASKLNLYWEPRAYSDCLDSRVPHRGEVETSVWVQRSLPPLLSLPRLWEEWEHGDALEQAGLAGALASENDKQRRLPASEALGHHVRQRVKYLEIPGCRMNGDSIGTAISGAI
eukprot:4900310-Prymnesium_polylepis.1